MKVHAQVIEKSFFVDGVTDVINSNHKQQTWKKSVAALSLDVESGELQAPQQHLRLRNQAERFVIRVAQSAIHDASLGQPFVRGILDHRLVTI